MKLGYINDYKNLYVSKLIMGETKRIKIVYSDNTNFIVDGQIISPFALDIENRIPVLVTSNQHVKKLKYYVNWFGLPRKIAFEPEKENQQLVIEEIKKLRKLGKI